MTVNSADESVKKSSYLILSLPEIMNLPYEETRWAIPGILPEGLTVLAGMPKIGKSWLVLNIALAVAQGTRVLGSYLPIQGDVLYLALEDDFKRITKRSRKILGTTAPTANFYSAIGCKHDGHDGFPGLIDGGLEAIKAWITEHPSRRLIIIDTAIRFLPPADHVKQSAYQADSSAYAQLQTFAMENHIALIVVHHTKKGDTTDVFDSILGSRGVTGSSDANWVLRKTGGQDSKIKLHIQGKDILDHEFDAVFHEQTGTWTLSEPEIEMEQNDNTNKKRSKYPWQKY